MGYSHLRLHFFPSCVGWAAPTFRSIFVAACIAAASGYCCPVSNGGGFDIACAHLLGDFGGHSPPYALTLYLSLPTTFRNAGVSFARAIAATIALAGVK